MNAARNEPGVRREKARHPWQGRRARAADGEDPSGVPGVADTGKQSCCGQREDRGQPSPASATAARLIDVT